MGLLGRRLCFAENAVHRAGGAATYLKRLHITGTVTLRPAGADSHCRSWRVYSLKVAPSEPLGCERQTGPCCPHLQHRPRREAGASTTPLTPLPRGCGESPQNVLSLQSLSHV